MSPPLAPGDAGFDELLAGVLEDPGRLLDGDALSADQVLALQRSLNPYAYVAGDAGDPSRKRVVALSFTNLREDYLRRFVMTGLVGFLFRMHAEWEPPAAARRWISKAGARRAAEARASAPAALTPSELLERAEGVAELARVAVEADAQATAARDAAIRADGELAALGALEAPAAERDGQAARAAELLRDADTALARARALHYTATFEMRRWGLECDARIDGLEALARQHPEVREELDKAPLRRPPPGQLEIPAEGARALVGSFLKGLFEFNPDAHVRSAHDAFVHQKAEGLAPIPGLGEVPVDEADPLRLPLSVVLADAPPALAEDREAVAALTASPQAYNAALYLLRHPAAAAAAQQALAAPSRFERYLGPIGPAHAARAAAAVVPPQDSFHQWQYYMEVNFEALRTATESIYHERPDLELAVALYRGFEGEPGEVDRAFEAFYQEHQDEVISDIRAVEMGGWTLLGDFAANRDKINFYNKNTEVLKRILDRHAEDKKIGQELMRNRVRMAKAANIAADGPDAPGLAEYAASAPAAASGARRVLSPEEKARLERAKGDLRAAKELELVDQCRETIRSLSEQAKVRPLEGDEPRRLREAQTDLARALEMLEVPDDALAVDVWAPGADGVLAKTQFYTRAEAPQPRGAAQPPLAGYALDNLSASLAEERAAAAEAAAEAAAAGGRLGGRG